MDKDKIGLRKQTRECAMQLLYEMEVQKDFNQEIKNLFLERLQELRDYSAVRSIDDKSYSAIDENYFNIVVKAATDHLDEIDELLSSSAENWRIDRISKVDLAVLRLSVAEIQYLDDIPNAVSINEAVDLAKKFGSEDSGKFVNGILGRIIRGEKRIK